MAADIRDKEREWRNAFSVKYASVRWPKIPSAALTPSVGTVVAIRTPTVPKSALGTDFTGKENPGIRADTLKRSAEKAKDSKKYFCSICGVSCQSNFVLNRHNRSSRHLLNVKKAKAGVIKQYRCSVCNYGTDMKGSMTRHNAGKLHKLRVAKAASK